jgi:hypothetical protein
MNENIVTEVAYNVVYKQIADVDLSRGWLKRSKNREIQGWIYYESKWLICKANI